MANDFFNNATKFVASQNKANYFAGTGNGLLKFRGYLENKNFQKHVKASGYGIAAISGFSAYNNLKDGRYGSAAIGMAGAGLGLYMANPNNFKAVHKFAANATNKGLVFNYAQKAMREGANGLSGKPLAKHAFGDAVNFFEGMAKSSTMGRAGKSTARSIATVAKGLLSRM